MGKQPNIDNQETPKEEVTPVQSEPLEVQKKEKVKTDISPSGKTTPISFSFTADNLANEEEMAPVRDILATGEEVQETGFVDVSFLTADEVANFLEATYQIQGVFTYPELWKRPKEFFYEIAEGILPNLNSWAARIPAVGHAIKTVSAAGSWGRLIWDMAFTWLRVNKQRELEREQKLEEEEGGQNYASTKPGGIIVP